MKKTLTSILLGTAIILFGIVVFNPAPKTEANSSSLASRILIGLEGSTSTPAYFTTSTATTSYAFLTERADSFEVLLAMTASTSATQLQYTVEYSNDNIDWYGEDVTSTSGQATTHLAFPPVHFWTPGSLTASTSRRDMKFTSIGSRYARLNVRVNSANAAFWAQVVTKEQNQ